MAQDFKKFHFDNSHIQLKHHRIFRIALHNHEYYEAELLFEGTGYSIINGKSFPASRGTLTFVSTPDTHGYRLCEDSDMIHISFSKDKIKNPDILELLKNSKSYVTTLDEADIQHFTSLHKMLSEEANSNSPFSEIATQTLIEAVAVFLLKKQGSNTVRKADTPPIHKALAYIDEHFTESCTLSEVSKYVFMSDEHFSRKFKSETGISFSRYVTEKRLAYAKRILPNFGLSVQDVAFESGFNSTKYFSETFKKHFGITPSEFRKDLLTHHTMNSLGV